MLLIDKIVDSWAWMQISMKKEKIVIKSILFSFFVICYNCIKLSQNLIFISILHVLKVLIEIHSYMCTVSFDKVSIKIYLLTLLQYLKLRIVSRKFANFLSQKWKIIYIGYVNIIFHKLK